ncbi:beta-1,3-galactosyltransferase 5-like [Haliotis rubra]|uniref:beta-1,3-galactosyltransferase 5-like n=1 Tax=Haliotis rubra TaxID=36100 RepID=UPI001EE5E55D|nr:beta-1,3-galactosyltransferase 5-like [Haliotis rubra]
MGMVPRLWFLYSIPCICITMYLCWNLGAMTSKPQLRRFCQQFMKGHETMRGTMSEFITEQTMSHTARPTTPASRTRPVSSDFYKTTVNGNNINHQIENHFTMLKNETKDPFVNQHLFSFIHTSEACSERSIFLLMVVHSAAMNYNKRDMIRTTFGSVKSYRDKRLAVAFILGTVEQQTLQDSINRESQLHHDIVQGNLLDSYKNLSRKHIMAMHWVKYNCNSTYILKLDDDTFVNPYRIIDFLLKENPQGMSMYCKVISGDVPNRRKYSKWYTPVSQYPFPKLPPYCLGFAYITTQIAWNALYKASETCRITNMDDLYVSVVLAMKAGVKKRSFENLLYKCPKPASRMTERVLNEKAIVLDIRNKCGDIPFTFFPRLQEMNGFD